MSLGTRIRAHRVATWAAWPAWCGSCGWSSRSRSLRIAALLVVAALMAACAGPPRGESVTGRQNVGDGAWRAIGRSVHGREIRAATFGSGRPRVLIVGGIHGNEPEPAPGVAQLARVLKESPDRGTVLLIEDINPDGTAMGTRGNARGVDLNRNWQTVNFVASVRHGAQPKSEPETALLASEIVAFAPEVIIVLHSIRSGPFVNFDGPAREYAQAFAQAAGATDPRWTVRVSMGYPTPGSLGTWAGVERQIPTLTVELARGHPADLAERAVVEGTLAVLRLARESRGE